MSMNVTFEEFMAAVRHTAERAGHDVSRGHPEDLVSALIPFMEGVAAGFTMGWKAAKQ